MSRVFSLIFGLILFSPLGVTYAAQLKVSPNTGVYTVGSPFTVSILLNTEGKAINASDGTLSYNTHELQVVSVSKTSSIFNLWTEEPSFSNSAGTVSFGGGSPSGYKGTGGTIMTVTFKALGAGTPKVNFTTGSALAADGMGTNVLTAMYGGTFTVAAKSDSPAPEYIPPANTPKAPEVISSTHHDQTKWYKESTADVSWALPSDVIAVRTLVDTLPGSIPTKVYDEPIKQKTIDSLSQGVSYFHIQFKNKEGWGRITHYKLSVDSESPKNFSISEVNQNENSAVRKLSFNIEDVSPILLYKIQIDGKDPIQFTDTENSKQYITEALMPGHHTFVIEAFDSTGNSSIANYAVTISAFEKPIFIDYPTRINTEVIPAIKGKTRPRSTITITVVEAQDNHVVNASAGESSANTYTTTSSDEGEFTFIPGKPFVQGVYAITATAKDELGNVSEPSDQIKIIVEAPGYVVFGSIIVSVLSVLVPAIALLLVLIFGSWYLWHKLVVWKRRVRKETLEAEQRLALEFAAIVDELNKHVTELGEVRKTKVSKAELDLITEISNALKGAEKRIEKEIEDIEHVI